MMRRAEYILDLTADFSTSIAHFSKPSLAAAISRCRALGQDIGRDGRIDAVGELEAQVALSGVHLA